MDEDFDPFILYWSFDEVSRKMVPMYADPDVADPAEATAERIRENFATAVELGRKPCLICLEEIGEAPFFQLAGLVEHIGSVHREVDRLPSPDQEDLRGLQERVPQRGGAACS